MMTPKACALYDKIKLHKIRTGYPLAYSKINQDEKDYVKELKNNGFIDVLYHYPKNCIPYKTIKLLK